jgi:hypothetical protein
MKLGLSVAKYNSSGGGGLKEAVAVLSPAVTGESIQISASRSAKFKPGKQLKDSLISSVDGEDARCITAEEFALTLRAKRRDAPANQLRGLER